MTIILSALSGFVSGFIGGFVAWFCSNVFGRRIVELWDLRIEAHRFLYYYANVKFDRPPDARNADDAQKCFRWLGARLDALRTSSPRVVIQLFVWWGYNLEGAATGLTGLSNTIAPGREEAATGFRVQAQRALQLPVNPDEQEAVDRAERLTGTLI